MAKTEVVGVRLIAGEVADLEAWAKRHGFATRTEAAREIIRAAIGDGSAPVIAPAPKGPLSPGRAAPLRARAVLKEAEAKASHLGARAMEAAGLPFGNIRAPYQKGRRLELKAPPRPGQASR